MHPMPSRIPVSIIIPNYNYARFLERSVDSALGQDHDDVEVIVVDDRSSDGSAAVIESYGDSIRACLRPRNGGHAAAFNTGFAASSGRIVLFLDADDYLYPDAVSRIVDAWDPATAQVQSRLHIVDEEQHVKDVFPPPELPFDDGDVVPKLLHKGRYQTTVTSGLAFDRSTLETIMPIPEADFRQGADGYLATLAPLYGQVQSIEECVGAYRIHGANHSVFGAKLAERARWRVAHDFHRMAALSGQVSGVGLAVEPSETVLHDTLHLEERLASLCADRDRHPVANDSKLALAAHGAVASLEMTASLRRRAMLAAWFLSVGMLPGKMALAVLSWKLDAASRPAFLARLAKTIRQAMG
ncbi:MULTISPECIES: glycosyltransferase [Mesorhizobium]|uniref:Glycosyltransferase n=1 Tax=Mesorhizobium abyssinicae TaxID=1209958 RepID=A0ABU5AT88_9HYPH|nr:MULTISPECIES: glycosyltransferase [Mesorhizobium]MDX8433634.1 glycosyltransferase [Mesorhizobium abyssinicae]MDX8540530.1 glycosyltransferase [Mesorhizobium abyssinicae]RUW20594.1 glycosyltransferase [Mesorhizobium sp. M4B.F.Ca.ET.013.02.1.1]RUW71598.1 glycosyltransferase [Mesorhizobium sp. M4B.F.Ca.ET.049.02.1.2]RVD16421.1 glycosyltransferase [Mesorhizobium sp. M4B.F.Ca.ET.017.02.2.1]